MNFSSTVSVMKTGRKRIRIGYCLAAMLAMLFTYASVSKLSDYERSKKEMLNQVFPKPVALHLSWMVPVAELITTGLLLFKATRLHGFYCSLLLMFSFSVYIAIAMTGGFAKIPCSCGGILKHMGYGSHLVFNLFFTAAALAGIILDNPTPINIMVTPKQQDQIN